MDFRYPYFVILIIGIIIGLIKYKLLTKSSKLFLLLLVVTLLFEVFVFYYTHRNKSNYIFYNLFIPLEYSIIAIGFYTEVGKKWILYSIALLLGFIFLSSFYISLFDEFNTNVLISNFFLITILCLAFLYLLLKEETEKSFIDFPMFWISSGFLIFCIGNLFAYGTYNLFEKAGTSPVIGKIFLYIRIYSNYLLYLLFAVAFLVRQSSLGKKDAIK